MPRPKKPKIEFLKVEELALEVEGTGEEPVIPDLVIKEELSDESFKSYCCRNTFNTLESLLEHMETQHYVSLWESIRVKRDLVLKCLNEDLPIQEDEKENVPDVDMKFESDVDMKYESDDMKEELNEEKAPPVVTKPKRKYTKRGTKPKKEKKPKRIKKEPVPAGPIDTRKFQCSVCQKMFMGLLTLQKHEKKHYGNYYCDMCGDGFFTKAKLKSHFFKHKLDTLQEKHLACIMCEIIFDNQSLIEAHLFEFHVQRTEGYQCESCPEKLSTKFNLICHVRRYHEFKKINCKYCYKTFKTVEDMEKHSKEHENESTDILCTHCGVYFKGLQRFRKHRHSVDKPLNFHCVECKKGFKSRRACEVHEINVHGIGDSKFTCITCGKGFANHADLKTHEVYHSDATPFTCSECPKAFKKKNHLKQHIEIHHTEGYTSLCLVCHKTLKSKETLRSHLRKVHKITMNEMYRNAGVPYKGRDILWSKMIQNREKNKVIANQNGNLG